MIEMIGTEWRRNDFQIIHEQFNPAVILKMTTGGQPPVPNPPVADPRKREGRPLVRAGVQERTLRSRTVRAGKSEELVVRSDLDLMDMNVRAIYDRIETARAADGRDRDRSINTLSKAVIELQEENKDLRFMLAELMEDLDA